MGTDRAVNILFRQEIEAAPVDEQAALRLPLAEEIRQGIDPYIAVRWWAVDDVIAPEKTRAAIISLLRMSSTKCIERPWCKHGVITA